MYLVSFERIKYVNNGGVPFLLKNLSSFLWESLLLQKIFKSFLTNSQYHQLEYTAYMYLSICEGSFYHVKLIPDNTLLLFLKKKLNIHFYINFMKHARLRILNFGSLGKPMCNFFALKLIKQYIMEIFILVKLYSLS